MVDKEHGTVVVIGRQFGCRGREIGRRIAEELGVDYYDKTLLSKAAESLGFSRRIFDSADEKRPSWLRSLLQFNYGVETASAEISDIDNEGLYHAQSKVIRRLADKGSCVIVGRTADYILRDHPGLLSIFLHAPLETRCHNIVARGDTDSHQRAADMARKMDRARESYYGYYTSRNWGRAETYHLCFDTSIFTPDEIAAVVKNHIDNRR